MMYGDGDRSAEGTRSLKEGRRCVQQQQPTCDRADFHPCHACDPERVHAGISTGCSAAVAHPLWERRAVGSIPTNPTGGVRHGLAMTEHTPGLHL